MYFITILLYININDKFDNEGKLFIKIKIRDCNKNKTNNIIRSNTVQTVID